MNERENVGKFVVLDVFFKGSSLNYDQGTGNYQPLKKITLWDGKQYTFVSRYAIRYSLIHSPYFEEPLLPGEMLTRAGEKNKTVIQPSPELLVTGNIAVYPELDLFGYLITDTTPQNAREAPVKISHAVSLVPYEYDIHMAANLDLAKRMLKKGEIMEPNPFTIEEHHTIYGFTVLIDWNRIGKFEIYLAKGIKEKEDSIIFNFKKSKTKIKMVFPSEIKEGESYERSKVKIYINDKEIKNVDDKNISGKVEVLSVKKKEKKKEKKDEKKSEVSIKISFEINKEEKENRIRNLLRSILRFTRTIKGGAGFSSPPILVIGRVFQGEYDTYKDRVELSREYEEIFEEEIFEEKTTNKKIVKKVQRVTSKPKFKLYFDYNEKNNEKEFIDEIMNTINNENKTMEKPIVFVRKGTIEIEKEV